MQNTREYNLTKYACYLGSACMSVVSFLSPLLFVTFHKTYEISYTLLGLLGVANFLTQLSVDLIFSFFSKYFDIHKTIRTMPVITFSGLLIYAIMPLIFPDYIYLWLIIGTIVFSASSGLGEVLLSPVIAAIPFDNPEREMSKLHSAYAWGCVVVAVISTLFLKIAGTHNWQLLTMILSVVPLTNAFIFAKAKLPTLVLGQDTEKPTPAFKNKSIFMFLICIFLAGASEITMSEWISSFIESGLGLPKLAGDILGVAMFSAMLGTGRTIYAKIGKNISSVMLFGMAGAAICYIVAGMSFNPLIGLIACSVTGLCVSMLWPGTLIFAQENLPKLGVALYALMAAGGDLGASVAPQLVGVLSDKIATMNFAQKLSQQLSITPEQVSVRAGMVAAAFFPMLGVVVVLITKRIFNKNNIK